MLCCVPLLQFLPPDIQDLWDMLRRAVLHYCRPPSADHPFNSTTRRQAAQDMFNFAKEMELRSYPNYMFTWNLHWAVCVLPRQEEARGSVGAAAEWWTERVMQYYKEVLGGRVTHDTEQVWDLAVSMGRACYTGRVYTGCAHNHDCIWLSCGQSTQEWYHILASVWHRPVAASAATASSAEFATSLCNSEPAPMCTYTN